MASTYPNVIPWIRQCLQERATGLEDEYFDPTIRSVLRGILRPAGGAWSFVYEDLTEDDQDRVDEAAGYLTAARLHGELLTGGVSTDLRSEDDGLFKRAFDGSLVDRWLAMAQAVLTETTFYKVAPTGSSFAVNGPSRSRCAEYQRDDCGGRCP